MKNINLFSIEKLKNMNKEDIIDFLSQQFDENHKDKGIFLSYSGKTDPWDIGRMIKPKITKTIYNYGKENYHNKNYIFEGENLSTMISLYKYRGQVDLILTDPPYNTGKDFRYNDSWDENPDNPNLGDLVAADDGSKHSKWLRFMAPRLYIMKEMLKSNGVIAICIDYRELYRLGILMDEIFGEKNRIGIINWQKNYSPKSGSTNISQSTEYVLIYSKNISTSIKNLEARTNEMNNRYSNPDNDLKGNWLSDNAVAKDSSKNTTFGIQSPFTGKFYYPNDNHGHWGQSEDKIFSYLEGWGVEYEKIKTQKTYFVKNKNKIIEHNLYVYCIKGWRLFENNDSKHNIQILNKSLNLANIKLKEGNWPTLIWGKKGLSGPRLKTYLHEVKSGKVPMTFWSGDEFEEINKEFDPIKIDSIAWNHNESGHSQAGVNELNNIIGKGHGFDTVKPLKLIKKIISLWCPSDGLILDPFAGSGTTAHACLELNEDYNYDRKFILIEQGNTNNNDYYAETLTAKRIKNVIDGIRFYKNKNDIINPIDSGFTYQKILNQKVNEAAVIALAREEMIDILTSTYWNKTERAKSHLMRIDNYKHLFAKNSKNEGFFLVWSGKSVGELNKNIYLDILKEAKENYFNGKYHIYAASSTYTSPNIEFYKIPDKVLEQLGFNEVITETE